MEATYSVQEQIKKQTAHYFKGILAANEGAKLEGSLILDTETVRIVWFNKDNRMKVNLFPLIDENSI